MDYIEVGRGLEMDGSGQIAEGLDETSCLDEYKQRVL